MNGGIGLGGKHAAPPGPRWRGQPGWPVFAVVAVALAVGACADRSADGAADRTEPVPTSEALGGDGDVDVDSDIDTDGDIDGTEARSDGSDDGPADVRSIDCPFDTAFVTEVECGQITLAGRGSDPDFEVDLTFARFLATGDPSEAQPDPVVFLHGGPGSYVLDDAPVRYDSIVGPFIERRDVILYDQRGAGQSSPIPRCPRAEQVALTTLERQFSAEEVASAMARALSLCADEQFEPGKLDPTAFSSVINAMDLVDLLAALDVAEYNIFGSSYGSLLAQAVLRDAPEGVRTVTITGVYPTDVSPFLHVPATIEIALDAVFAGCAADERCDEALPDPWGSLDALLADLDRDPAWPADTPGRGPITPAVLDGDRLLSAIHAQLYNREGAGMITDLLIDVEDGDLTRLRRLAENAPTADPSIMAGLLVVCADERPFPASQQDRAPADRPSLARWDDALGLLGEHTPTYCDAIADDWPAAGQNDPVTWDVPTLILSGAADPITPESWARRLADRLPRGRLLVDPSATHDASTGWCSSGVIADFVDRPELLPDLSCFDSFGELRPNNKAIRFVDGLEPSEVELDIGSVGPVEVTLPDWLPYRDETTHIRWRDLDQLDLSALVVRSADDSSDVLEYLGYEWDAGSWSPESSSLTPPGWERSERPSFVANMVRYVDESTGVALVLVTEPGDPDDLERLVLAAAARSLVAVE